MKDITISKLAYSKLFLHLAKYPHLSCNGLLLSKKNKNQTIQYVDCIPLFHSSLTLAPAFEIALTQIDTYCQQNDFEISAYYHAFDNNNENQPNLICYKIAEKLKENCSNSLCLMVNNSKIHPSNKEPCFRTFNFGDDQRLKEVTCNVKLDEGTFDTCLKLLNEKKFNCLNDFDNHLDDIKLDWRNSNLNGSISSIESLSSN